MLNYQMWYIYLLYDQSIAGVQVSMKQQEEEEEEEQEQRQGGVGKQYHGLKARGG